jgi:hypothetical protein
LAEVDGLHKKGKEKAHPPTIAATPEAAEKNVDAISDPRDVASPASRNLTVHMVHDRTQQPARFLGAEVTVESDLKGLFASPWVTLELFLGVNDNAEKCLAAE